MKVPVAWMRSLLRRTISNDEIIKAIEASGIELEQKISSKEFDRNIVLGLVTKVIQHPEADRLHIANVQTGERELSIVCGAPNVRPGMVAAVAQVGSILPDGTKIVAAKLRGHKSEGMLCSGRELGLSDDYDGLMEFPAGSAPGTALCDMYPAEVTVDIKTAANRSDLQSIVGLAREVAAFAATELQELVEPAAGTNAAGRIEMDAAAISAPRFMLAEYDLGGLDAAKLPTHMAAWLGASGVRSLLPVVDVTNYVMLEYGQPLHAYDADKVTLPIGVRLARSGETLVTLDGTARELTDEDLVVADANGPIGLAGVMGGAESQVTAATKRIYLEAASFDGPTIRRTARRHNLRSEASARYERGLPVQAAAYGLARAGQILAGAGAVLAGPVADELRVWPWIQRIGLPLSRLRRLTGDYVTAEYAVAALRSLEISADKFDIVAEARKFLGRPYRFGARFREDGVEAFDCSYLTDYLYSLVGIPIGHTAHAQFKSGRPVELGDLRPGDLVFRGGPFEKRDEQEREGVSHVALYIGEGRIIHAIDIERDAKGNWRDRAKQAVTEEGIEVISDDPAYLGARRYADGLEHMISVAHVPWWRNDLKLPEDLVEDIVRVRGYGDLPARIPAWKPKTVEIDHATAVVRRVKDLLSGNGLFETMTYSFVGDDQLAAAQADAEGLLRLENPLSSEQAYLRSSLLPSQLAVATRNRGYSEQFGFYEISRVYIRPHDDGLPREPRRLAITIVSPKDAYRITKGHLDALAWSLGVEVEVKPGEPAPAYAAGRTGVVKVGGRKIGSIGQVKPGVVRGLKLGGEVAFLEIDLEPLLRAARPRTYRPLGRFPGIVRDLTVRVAPNVTYAAIKSAITGDRKLAQAGLRASIDFVGDFMPEGGPYKNLTIRIALSLPDRTLGDQEANDYEAAVRRILDKAFTAAA